MAYEILYFVWVSLIKTSILLFYYRLLGVRKALKYACYVVFTRVIAGLSPFVLSSIFQCIPIEATWIRPYPHSKCIESNASLLETAITNVLLDFVILFQPMAPVRCLSLTVRKTLILTATFLLGALQVSNSINLVLSPSFNLTLRPPLTVSTPPPLSASGPSSTSTRLTSPGPTSAPSSAPASKSQWASPTPASQPCSPSFSSALTAAFLSRPSGKYPCNHNNIQNNNVKYSPHLGVQTRGQLHMVGVNQA